jgi:hypothetical protein
VGVISALGTGRRSYREHSLNLKRHLFGFCYHQNTITISIQMLRQLD